MPLERSKRCSAITRNGHPCKAFAADRGTCALHSDSSLPKRLGELSGASRRRPITPYEDVSTPKDLNELRTQLSRCFADLQAGKLEPRLGSAISYMANVLISV